LFLSLLVAVSKTVKLGIIMDSTNKEVRVTEQGRDIPVPVMGG